MFSAIFLKHIFHDFTCNFACSGGALPEQGPVGGSVGARKKPSTQGQTKAPGSRLSVLEGHGSHLSPDAAALKKPG